MIQPIWGRWTRETDGILWFWGIRLVEWFTWRSTTGRDREVRNTHVHTHLFMHLSIPSTDFQKCDTMMYYSTYSALNNISDFILVKMSMKLTMVSYILINTQFTMAFPGRNPCQVNNGGCSQLCFPTSENTRSCSCTVGYSLRTDRMSCEGKTASLL